MQVASFRPLPPEAKHKTAGRNEIMSPLPAVSPRSRESNGQEFRGPMSKRAVSIVDVRRRSRIAAGGPGHRGVAIAVLFTRRDERDLVHVHLYRGSLFAFLAFSR